MRLIVAGGTGFVGKNLVRGLLGDGHEVTILQRPQSKNKTPFEGEVAVAYVNQEHEVTSGDLEADAIINLVGIIREYPSDGVTFHGAHFLVTKNLVEYARKKGIRIFLQMSALGVGPKGKTDYQRTKYAGEKYLQESGLDWTIYRPSLIYGPNGFLIEYLSGMIRKLPLVPVIGNGEYKVQPVHVDDVGRGFRRALDGMSKGMIFEFGGPEIMTYNRMLDIIGEVICKRKVRKLHHPVWMLRPITALMQGLRWYPMSNEQITMLIEGNFTSDNTFFDHFGITPITFKEGLETFLR